MGTSGLSEAYRDERKLRNFHSTTSEDGIHKGYSLDKETLPDMQVGEFMYLLFMAKDYGFFRTDWESARFSKVIFPSFVTGVLSRIICSTGGNYNTRRFLSINIRSYMNYIKTMEQSMEALKKDMANVRKTVDELIGKKEEDGITLGCVLNRLNGMTQESYNPGVETGRNYTERVKEKYYMIYLLTITGLAFNKIHQVHDILQKYGVLTNEKDILNEKEEEMIYE